MNSPLKAAVLGSPIHHSLSPTIHMAAYKFLGVEIDYSAIEVPSGSLPDFLSKIDDSWVGFSLTMPLKEETIEVAATVDPLALRINSANTLVKIVSGWHATSTDVAGFHSALVRAGITNPKRVVILGSGATARAAAAAVDSSECEIFVAHRSFHRELAMRSSVLHSEIRFLEWGSVLPDCDLLINTTPAHAADSLTDSGNLPTNGVLFEALYNPWPTELFKHWNTYAGARIDGLELLIGQAISQIELFTREPCDAQALWPLMRQAALASLGN